MPSAINSFTAESLKMVWFRMVTTRISVTVDLKTRNRHADRPYSQVTSSEAQKCWHMPKKHIRYSHETPCAHVNTQCLNSSAHII